MTDEQVKMIADSINKLADAVETLWCRIAEDNSLGKWLSTAITDAAKNIIRKRYNENAST